MRERIASIQSHTQRTMEQIGNADTDPALGNSRGNVLNNRAQFILNKKGVQAKPLRQAVCRWSRNDKQTFPSRFQTYLTAAAPRIQLKNHSRTNAARASQYLKANPLHMSTTNPWSPQSTLNATTQHQVFTRFDTVTMPWHSNVELVHP
jgi:hypothetical protein